MRGGFKVYPPGPCLCSLRMGSLYNQFVRQLRCLQSGRREGHSVNDAFQGFPYGRADIEHDAHGGVLRHTADDQGRVHIVAGVVRLVEVHQVAYHFAFQQHQLGVEVSQCGEHDSHVVSCQRLLHNAQTYFSFRTRCASFLGRTERAGAKRGFIRRRRRRLIALLRHDMLLFARYTGW